MPSDSSPRPSGRGALTGLVRHLRCDAAEHEHLLLAGDTRLILDELERAAEQADALSHLPSDDPQLWKALHRWCSQALRGLRCADDDRGARDVLEQAASELAALLAPEHAAAA